MAVLLQIDFPSDGPWGDQMSQAYADLADTIAAYRGLHWKIWTESANARRAGGVYLFESDAAARAYLAEHTERLHRFGITDIRAIVFDVNAPLSEQTRAPLG